MEWLLKSSALNKLHTLHNIIHNIKSRCYATRKDRFHKIQTRVSKLRNFCVWFHVSTSHHMRRFAELRWRPPLSSHLLHVQFVLSGSPHQKHCHVKHSFCSHCLARTVASSLVKKRCP